MRRAVVLFTFAFVTVADRAAAHEFWIEPADFGPSPNTDVPLRFFVGERFHGEELPWDPSRIEELAAVSNRGLRRLSGEAFVTPAAWVRVDGSGPELIIYKSRPATIELEAAAFNSYLLDDGLYAPLARRREAGTFDAPGRERFTRYAKTLLALGAHSAEFIAQPVGHRLEILPETSARSLDGGASEIVVRILFEGAPLASAVIFAAPAENPAAGLLRAVTDREGCCRFALASPGPWMVSLVHMVECHDCAGADWDSSWATLVFARGEPSLSVAP